MYDKRLKMMIATLFQIIGVKVCTYSVNKECKNYDETGMQIISLKYSSGKK